jgi:hypothetical protein
MNNKTIVYTLPFIGLITVLITYFFVVAFYNTKICDDVIATNLVNELGKLNYIKHIYTNWEGSYSQGIVSSIIAPLWNGSTLLVYTVMLGAFTVYAFSVMLSYIIKCYLPQFNNKVTIVTIALLSFLSIFFSAPDVASTGMVWFTGSYSYLLSVSFLLIGTHFIVKKNTTNIAIGVLCMLFFAGFRLNYTVYTFAITCVMLAYNLFYLRDTTNYKTYLLVLLVLAIGLVIYIVAPGNAKRAQASGMVLNAGSVIYSLTHIEFWKLFFSGIVYMIKVHFIKTSVVSIIVLTPIFFILEITPFKNLPIKKLFFTSLALLIFTLLLHVFLLTLIMGGTGPSRTYVFIYILKTTTLLCGLYWLYSLVNVKKYFYILSIFYVPITLIFAYKLFSVDYSNMYAFHQQKLNRIKIINTSIQNNTNTLTFTPLVKCNFLPSEDNCQDFDPRLQGKVIIIK